MLPGLDDYVAEEKLVRAVDVFADELDLVHLGLKVLIGVLAPTP
ncbi:MULTISPECIES: hypothetical protein [Pseudomonas]